MKVNISQNEVQQGLVFKKNFIAVTVEVGFSEQELAIIQERKLQKAVLLEREPDAWTVERQKGHPDYLESLKPSFVLDVKKLMKGPDTYKCANPIGAKRYQSELVEALKQLKGYIEGNAQVEQGTSFEL